MRKLTLACITFLLTLNVADAQTTSPAKYITRLKALVDSIRKTRPVTLYLPTFGNRFVFPGKISSNPRGPMIIEDILSTQDNFLYMAANFAKMADPHFMDSLKKMKTAYSNMSVGPTSKIVLGVKLEAQLTNYRGGSVKAFGKDYARYTINNGTEAQAIAMGITPANVNEYKYHVVLNDSTEVVPWTTPKLEKQYGATAPYGALGKYKYPGKQVLIEVINQKDYSIRDGLLFDWRPEQAPVITSFSARAYSNLFSLNDNNRGYSKHIDAKTNLPTDLKFPAKSIDEMTFRFAEHEGKTYQFFVTNAGEKKQTYFYQAVKGDEFILRGITIFNKPGKYQIVVAASTGQTIYKTVIPFEVTKALPGSIETKHYWDYADQNDLTDFGDAGTYAVIILVVVGIGFGIYYLDNQNKLRKAEQARAMAAMQLKSVRSQLNPHFMFNALTSIQNLMNQHDTEGANHYLSKFAGLTRQVLKTSGQELISLNDELQIITDYLEMEQLRFGFKYSIEVDSKINKPNTEIPAMLLQPFIENAAKHGVSALQSNGEIKVSIVKDGSNLIFTIQDNGPGFGGAANPDGGHGLKLSRERILLLNQLYKDQPIALQVNIKDPGAKIVITLTDWV